MMLFAAGDWLTTWLTPLWLIGLGAILSLVVLLVIWGVVSLFSRSAMRAVPEMVREGPLLPVGWTVLAAAAFGVAGFFFLPNTMQIVRSVERIPFTGHRQVQITVPGAHGDSDPERLKIPMNFNPHELRTVECWSDRSLRIFSQVEESGLPIIEWEIEADEDFYWDRGILSSNPFEQNGMDFLWVENQTENDATLTLETYTAPFDPQAITVVISAVSIVTIVLIYLAINGLFPKMSAIALATSKSEMAQPLYLILLGLGVTFILLFMLFPYYTFGEDIKVLKDSSFTLIMVFAIIHALWAASNSVADEIDGKTALTVLSKPINRRQFVIGKFIGISWTTAVMFIVLGVWLLVIVCYKPIYDARETANQTPTWQECHLEMVRTVPGLFLAYLETLIFAAISVAISTRLSILGNVMICFSIYALGHLTPLMVESGAQQLENVEFVAKFIATVLPVLDHFNIQAAIASGVRVSYTYLAIATAYCALYCTIAMLLGLLLFEDRDLA